jgi:hypothetical protein
MFHTHWLAVKFHAVELDDELGIRIIDGKQLVTTGEGRHPQLFEKLPAGCSLDGFSRLEFAPRKLPKVPVALVGRAPTHQEMPVAFDHGSHYANFLVSRHWQPNGNQAWFGMTSSIG